MHNILRVCTLFLITCLPVFATEKSLEETSHSNKSIQLTDRSDIPFHTPKELRDTQGNIVTLCNLQTNLETNYHFHQFSTLLAHTCRYDSSNNVYSFRSTPSLLDNHYDLTKMFYDAALSESTLNNMVDSYERFMSSNVEITAYKKAINATIQRLNAQKKTLQTLQEQAKDFENAIRVHNLLVRALEQQCATFNTHLTDLYLNFIKPMELEKALFIPYLNELLNDRYSLNTLNALANQLHSKLAIYETEHQRELRRPPFSPEPSYSCLPDMSYIISCSQHPTS